MAATQETIVTGPSAIDWTVYAGDRNRHLFNTPGGPVDITGALIESQARMTAPDPAVAATGLVTIVDPLTGAFTVEWDGEELRTLLAGADTLELQWDVQITEVGETLPRTMYRGALTVVHDVTRLP